jgi:hypothetical protein
MAFTHTVIPIKGNRVQVRFENERGESYTRTMYLPEGGADSLEFLEQVDMQKSILEERITRSIISSVSPS